MRQVFTLVFLTFLMPHVANGLGQVIQFLVHADDKTDITRLFPGAVVDFTWNDIFIISIWTTEPDLLIRSIKQTLTENTNVVQVLIPPYTLAVSTQKWLSSNLVWVALLVLIFISGCACGGGLVLQCFNARRAIYRPQRV